jgi:hypothetical protein
MISDLRTVVTRMAFDTLYMRLLQLPWSYPSRRYTMFGSVPSLRDSTLRQKFRDVSLVSAAVPQHGAVWRSAWIRS